MKWFKYMMAIGAILSSSAFAGNAEDDFKAGELQCLALNVYFEARSSNVADMAAVSDVVLNRVMDRRYPDTICKVITQGPIRNGVPVRNKCQFSWWCDGKSDQPRDMNAWNKSQLVAYQIMYNDRFRGITEGSTHYHAKYVNPKWAKRMVQIGRIGEHIFYRSE